MRIDHERERVVIVIGDALCRLTVREAMDATTAILQAVDGARAYGAYLRGEVADPDPRKNTTPRRQYRRKRSE